MLRTDFAARGVHSQFCGRTQQHRKIRIYPNPAGNSVTISVDETMLGATTTITDITGRKILAVELATSNFSKSVYFIRIQDERGNKVVRRLVIQ
ncbi:MAG: T9SS type A sorting domain-containing protein [Bacteroidota bacterium]